MEPIDLACQFPTNRSPAAENVVIRTTHTKTIDLTTRLRSDTPLKSGADAHSDVIDRCRKGDREAFRQLYDLYQQQVFSIALYYLGGDRAAAEDVAQTVFVRLFSAIKDFRQSATFSTWLYSLVANACRDEHRRRKRLVGWSGGDVVSGETRLDEDELAIRHTIRDVLAELQPDFRITVLLKYFEELSYVEIAEVLGCQPGTVASRLNRCHKILARKLACLNPHVREVSS